MTQTSEMLETQEQKVAPAWPSSTRAWATVFVLLAAYAVAFIDRQILTLLVEPIQRDLDITDTQFSLLSGLAFTLFYTLMGIPLGWLADRGSRRKLILVSVLFWSAMTAACGMAKSFGMLFLADPTDWPTGFRTADDENTTRGRCLLIEIGVRVQSNGAVSDGFTGMREAT